MDILGQGSNGDEDLSRVHELLKKFKQRKISRRNLLKGMAASGIALSSLMSPWSSAMAEIGKQKSTKSVNIDMGGRPQEVDQWLREVSKPYRGETVKVITESTPPNRAIKNQVKEYFEPATGIQVDWELTPLPNVLEKISIDAAAQLGRSDIWYLDQAWIARFDPHTANPRQLWDENPEMALPNYDFDDFIDALVQQVATHGDSLVGLPTDIPIFITMYRRDVFEEMGLEPPQDFDEFIATAKAINEEYAPEIYGSVGQWKSGHYSLFCDYTQWLWGYGGSLSRADGNFALNDERAIHGLEKMMEFGEYVPPGATSWDWSGEAEYVAQGNVGMYFSWGEFFPMYDTPEKSQVVGLMEPARCPQSPMGLRSTSETGYGETPGGPESGRVSHQGGSVLALSRYSNNTMPAWILLQWATSADVQTRGSIVGGGASPMRESTFADPRVKKKAVVTPGTTRHFDVQEKAIRHDMATETHLPEQPIISTDIIAVELGKLMAGEYDSPKECADVMQNKVEDLMA